MLLTPRRIQDTDGDDFVFAIEVELNDATSAGVCILGPYTADDKVDSLTGIQGAAGQAHDIRSNDGINVLMFVSDARIAASVAHARNQGDFGPEVVGKCYSREQANFSVRVPPANSWGNIGPG